MKQINSISNINLNNWATGQGNPSSLSSVEFSQHKLKSNKNSSEILLDTSPREKAFFHV